MSTRLIMLGARWGPLALGALAWIAMLQPSMSALKPAVGILCCVLSLLFFLAEKRGAGLEQLYPEKRLRWLALTVDLIAVASATVVILH